MRRRSPSAAGLAVLALAGVAGQLLVGCAADPDGPQGASRASSGGTRDGAGLVVAEPADGWPDPPPDGQEAVVARVVDGDTLVLEGRGDGHLPPGQTRVRLLEVAAPESVTPDRPVECFGPEAGDALRALAPEGAVLTVAADREPVDRFGRALLYAWTQDGVFVNEALVRGGYAEAVLVGDNDRWIDRLRAAEREAQDAGKGLWGECPDR